MGFQHFSHIHPLVLNEEHKLGGGDVYCVGCHQPIWGPSYRCISCGFFLHKLCAELPKQLTHPKHPGHNLLLCLPSPYGNCTLPCAICGKSCDKFYYYCSSSCNFQIDIICLLMIDNIQHKIDHKCHEHPLTYVHRPALFLCPACGIEHRGASFLCTTCGFWVNLRCASLPSTVESTKHLHPLSLAYILPEEFYIFWRNCDICHQHLNDPHWVYYCAGCRFFSHLFCAASTVKLSRDLHETEVLLDESGMTSPKNEELNTSIISLPLAEESIDAISLLFNDMNLQGKAKKAAEINHGSHDHPLILVDKQFNNELCDEFCNGCAQPISSPLYHCPQCNFSLHERCAELPKEIHHPCHPEHPLVLITRPETTYPFFRCRNCQKCCNVFMFGCTICGFYLDTRCASLPHFIKHEGHEHTLGLKDVPSESCNACHNSSGFLFVCQSCKFNVCGHCALLPAQFAHISDVHPFALTYSPAENHLHQFFCKICEEEADPKCWYYYCVDCDQSLHTGCVRPRNYDEYSNVKFWGTVKLDSHPHLLTFVKCPKNNPPGPPCGRCGQLYVLG